MTTVEELTPHQWQADERHILRAFILTLAEGNYQRAQEHAASLPMEARRELLYALDVGHPMVRALVEVPQPAPHESCPRCGHQMRWHSTDPEWIGCMDCSDRRCAPVVLPKETP